MMTTKEYGLQIMNRTMKSKIYEFDPVLYPFPIHVTKDFDKEELKSIYKAWDSEEKEVPIDLDVPSTTTARTIQVVDTDTGNLFYLVCLFHPEDVGVGIASHEADHIANAYLQDLGFAAPTPWNDEPHAYFVQWVTNCIWSVLIDETDKMKGKLYEVEKG